MLQRAEPFLEKGYFLYFDNLFSSFPLLKELLYRNIFACGTVRSDRKHYPKEKIQSDKSLERSEYDFTWLMTFLPVNEKIVERSVSI